MVTLLSYGTVVTRVEFQSCYYVWTNAIEKGMNLLVFLFKMSLTKFQMSRHDDYGHISIYSIFSFKHAWLNKIDALCLFILSLICSSLHLSRLTLEWNEFKKAQYVSQVISPLEPSSGERIIKWQRQWRDIVSYKSRRKNKWKRNLWRIKIFI